MAKISIYLKDPEEEILIESTPPKTFLDVQTDKEFLVVSVYEIKITGKRNFWTNKKIEEITCLRKDSFPKSRIVRTKTEGRLGR